MAKVSLRHYNREIETMIDRGQLDEAIAHCQHILKTFPKHLETYRLLGKAYLEYRRQDDASDIFLRVIAAEPNDFVANVGMSIIRDEQNKLDDAVWHMERAFEVQPSNPAIQSELQRLYGRRDGVTPPRIRMTRGALAHMYVQGELYPQAVSEIKSVLKEDQGRNDMQVLLARAYYKSGQKNDAAEAANSVLRRYPYCLDANRVLVEILGADRPENAQVYRQRVFELDPYAAQVTGTVFQSNEVGDNAVSLEPLDWNGQPVKMESDWGETRAIAPESGRGAQDPDWLKSGFSESTPPPVSVPPPAKTTVVPPVQAFPAASAPTASSEPAAQLTPEEDIPEFLRAAGWGKSTGEFDESKSSFEEELASTPASDESIEQADLPDWVKDMMPQEAAQTPATSAAQPAEEEELPDWIKNIGPGAVAATAAVASAETPDWFQDSGEPAPSAEESPDWMQSLEQPAQPTPTDEQPDWMKGIEQPAETTSALPVDDSLDWLQGIDQPAAETQPDWMQESAQPAGSSDDTLNWLQNLDRTETASPAADEPSAPETQPDWMTAFGATEPAPADEQPEWLKASSEQPAPQAQPEATDELDWLKDVGETGPVVETPKSEETAPPVSDMDFFEAPAETPTETAPPVDMGNLGTSQQEIDDSLAWLENLAAKQGATEGLLTTPEERLQEEPDWVKKIKGSTPRPAELAQPEPSAPGSVKQEPPIQPAPAANVEDLGKSQQEIDDSLAWLENLAAKQGATEGLLTKPEERLEDEPEWVKQAKSAPPSQEPIAQTPIESTPEPEQETAEQLAPAASVEDLGKSQQEIDDSLAWLENLAAKQGATEGLLTKPEERLEDEPEWVKQAKSAPAAASREPAPPEPDAAAEEEFEDSGPDTETWMRSLGQQVTEPEPEPVKDDTAMWLDSLDAVEESAPVSEPVPSDEMPDWLRTLEVEETKPAMPVAADATSMWMKDLDQVEETPAEQASTEDVPNWLKESEAAQSEAAESVVPAKEAGGELGWLDEVESESAASPVLEDDNLPTWLRGVDEEARKPATGSLGNLPGWLRDESGEALVEPTKIEPTRPTDWQPEVEPQPEPEPPQPKPEPVAQTQVEAQPKPAPAPRKPAEPKSKREPATVRGTGMSTASVDTILDSARSELSRSNIPGALEAYEKLIKKGRFLDEVIFDLREALDRFPVEVSILQSLGDAYMRANRLQDALDSYTKAEELLR